MKSIMQIIKKSQFEAEYSKPLWETFAKRIRSSRGNACQVCKRTGVMTQVHHVAYEAGKKPWEYPDEDVVLLCEPCHSQLHVQLQRFRRHVFGKLKPREFQILNGALKVALEEFDSLEFVHALAEFVATPNLVKRYAKSWEAGTKVDV